MSYARFADDSDVYVFASVGGWLECCGCALKDGGQARFFSTRMMLNHLAEHTEQGHDVPGYCVERLKKEAVDNDAWVSREQEKKTR